MSLGASADATTGTKYAIVHKDKAGNATKGIYLDSNGKTCELTYSLNATINAGDADYVAYYSAANTIVSAKAATSMIMPAHYYHNTYNNDVAGTEVYVHFYNSASTATNTNANFRVKSGTSYKTFIISGGGESSWNGSFKITGGGITATAGSINAGTQNNTTADRQVRVFPSQSSSSSTKTLSHE